ncbi:MAG: peptidylprolyl isomerase [Nitrososphaeria archaeon]|nr:peptidylprolyl isomerase [Nitrosopumilaceae archaeon]NIP09022.1 peptidylprolyl isomerase [Nitrosopumilaceae archaeon]NIP91392.1 peptidylprolyl isomerase [Nitrososphaeria archaeon]NIS95218.1 peptidylprolyl isomerase [Nitrosopumilaceae archaeon]
MLSFSPAFGQLSDATGLVNRFDIETGGHIFEITTTANFDVTDVDFDKDAKQLTFHIVSSLENNLGEIIIPSNLLSGNFTFLLNDQNYQPKIKTNDRIAFITLNFTGAGENKVDVFATNYLQGVDEVEPEINGSSEENLPQDEGGGCLIATATFDSELSPQVQQLRELRDNKLLKTQSGTAFIKHFNEFYYSFSPYIADYERENPLFKEAVKLTITPMLASLSILNHVNLNSEAQVVGFGLSVIGLNLGMYFAMPALIYLRFRK